METLLSRISISHIQFILQLRGKKGERKSIINRWCKYFWHTSHLVFFTSHHILLWFVWVKITVENTQDAKTDTLLTSERADLAGPELIMDCINENFI